MNFNEQKISGYIIHDMVVQQDVEFIVFDIWDLQIEDAILCPAGAAQAATDNNGNVPYYTESLNWRVVDPPQNPGTGTALIVQLPLYYGVGQEVSIQIHYQSAAGGNLGANFLRASQTSYKTDPFFFSYSFMIQGRMLAPQQDTPANKITYGACVTTNNNLVVGMSAQTTGTFSSLFGLKKTCFSQPIQMPNYLMACVAGNLVQAEITNFGGVTSYIWAEPNMIAPAQAEFSNLQSLLATVEDFIQIPYGWGDFQRIVVMPPSYPMGGMGNPLLQYVSPTTIVGDKSQEYVLAKNMAQFWFGANTTNDNWEDIWLSEGIATYVERMVHASWETIYFVETEAFAFNASLSRAVNGYGKQNETYSSLHPVLHGANPGYIESIVQWEKGFQFLWWLEQNVFNYYEMQDFMTYYIDMNAYASINAFDFRRTFSNYVQNELFTNDNNAVNAALAEIDYAMWIYTYKTNSEQ